MALHVAHPLIARARNSRNRTHTVPAHGRGVPAAPCQPPARPKRYKAGGGARGQQRRDSESGEAAACVREAAAAFAALQEQAASSSGRLGTHTMSGTVIRLPGVHNTAAGPKRSRPKSAAACRNSGGWRLSMAVNHAGGRRTARAARCRRCVAPCNRGDCGGYMPCDFDFCKEIFGAITTGGRATGPVGRQLAGAKLAGRAPGGARRLRGAIVSPPPVLSKIPAIKESFKSHPRPSTTLYDPPSSRKLGSMARAPARSSKGEPRPLRHAKAS